MDIQRPCLLALRGCLGKNYQKHSQVDAPHRGKSLSWWFWPCHSGGGNRADSQQSTAHWCVLRAQGFQCFDLTHAIDWALDDATGPDLFMKSDQYRKSWRKTQALADKFWKRWLSEYLPFLQPRQKWFTASPNLEPGALVLLCDSNTPRGCWSKALVEECFPDKSSLVRRVRLRMANVVLMRDVRKLCLLEAHLWCV